MLRIMIVDEVSERAEALQPALERLGHEVIAYMPSAFDLHAQVCALQPDIIIIDTDSPDRDTLKNVCIMSRYQPRPVVMFSHDGDGEKIRDATRAGVSAYVVDGMAAARVGHIIDAAIARFEQFQALKRELENAETKLAERKLIDRAKGILMKTRNLTEAEAYAALRNQAMRTNARLPDIARKVLELANLIAS